eukprot:4889239-Pyramimonas_sp.AAC.1
MVAVACASRVSATMTMTATVTVTVTATVTATATATATATVSTGVIISALGFAYKQGTQITASRAERKQTAVYTLQGALFFGSVMKVTSPGVDCRPANGSPPAVNIH